MRVLSLLLVTSMVWSSAGFAAQLAPISETSPGQTEETSQVTRVKAEVLKHGTGKKSRVRVTLENGTKIKGYVSKINEASFEVKGNKSGQATSVSYADVQKIQGPGLSTGAKVGIAVAAAAVVIAVIAAIAWEHFKHSGI